MSFDFDWIENKVEIGENTCSSFPEKCFFKRSLLQGLKKLGLYAKEFNKL